MKKHNAFTLIELLVVVAIIALLIALLLPTLAKAKDEALLVRCGANLHEISLSLATYTGQNRDLMPQTEEFYLPGWFHKDPPQDLAELSWCEALIADGDVAQGTNKNGALGGVSPPGETWVYPAAGRYIFQCPKHDAVYQNGAGDLRPVQGYGMAWCASSDFTPCTKFNNTSTLPVTSHDLNTNHIIVAEGWEMMARNSVGYLDPAISPFGVFQRHKRNSAMGAEYLIADGHVEWSSTYGHMPSPRGRATNAHIQIDPHLLTTPVTPNTQRPETSTTASLPPNDIWVHP